MPRARLIACLCAIAWVYVGVAGVLWDIPKLLGPAAFGFVLALFCACSLDEPFDEPVEKDMKGDEGHRSDPLFFGPNKHPF